MIQWEGLGLPPLVLVQSCAGERALGGRPLGVWETPHQWGRPSSSGRRAQGPVPGEGALPSASAPWATTGHPSAWESLKLGPARAGCGGQTEGSALVTNACLGDQRDEISDVWEEAGDLGEGHGTLC